MSPTGACPRDGEINRIVVDMYHGDARKAGVTTRLENMENRMEGMESLQQSTDRKFWAIILLLISSLAGITVDILTHRR